MLILVTGAAGYVGVRAVSRLLSARHTVRALDSLKFGGAALLGDIAGRWAVITIVILVVTIAALILLPAVWSSKAFRRKAALDVIDRFTGRKE